MHYDESAPKGEHTQTLERQWFLLFALVYEVVLGEGEIKSPCRKAPSAYPGEMSVYTTHTAAIRCDRIATLATVVERRKSLCSLLSLSLYRL